jgi:hypothetical protein
MGIEKRVGKKRGSSSRERKFGETLVNFTIIHWSINREKEEIISSLTPLVNYMMA